MKNYYKILGVPMNAGPEEIKQAYKSLIGIYDPQLHADDRYSYERYQNITIAYNTLMNPERRRDYDRILGSILSPAELRELQRARQSGSRDTPLAQAPQEQAQTHPDSRTLAPAARRSRLRPLVYAAASLALILAPGIYLFQLVSESGEKNSPALAWNSWKISDSPALQSPFESLASGRKLKESAPVPSNDEEKAELKRATDSPVEATPKAIKPESESITSLKDPAPQEVKSPLPISRPSADKEAKEVPVLAAHSESWREERESEVLPLGTSQVEVLKRQGTPSTIVRYGPDQETWLYLDGSIHFRNGRMISYNSEHQPMGLTHPRQISQ